MAWFEQIQMNENQCWEENRNDFIGKALEICNIKVESHFQGEKNGSSSSSSKSVGDGAGVKAVANVQALRVASRQILEKEISLQNDPEWTEPVLKPSFPNRKILSA